MRMQAARSGGDVAQHASVAQGPVSSLRGRYPPKQTVCAPGRPGETILLFGESLPVGGSTLRAWRWICLWSAGVRSCMPLADQPQQCIKRGEWRRVEWSLSPNRSVDRTRDLTANGCHEHSCLPPSTSSQLPLPCPELHLQIR